jgi:hypothetical protein
MIPHVYKETNRSDLKTPVLKLVEVKNGVSLAVVDESGDPWTFLLTFYEEGCIADAGAYEALKDGNYDTSFAEWNDHGCMCIELDFS